MARCLHVRRLRASTRIRTPSTRVHAVAPASALALTWRPRRCDCNRRLLTHWIGGAADSSPDPHEDHVVDTGLDFVGAAEATARRTLQASDFGADMLPALNVLAESLQMVQQIPAFQNWTSADWLLGLTVMAQHNTVQRRKKRREAAMPSAVLSPTHQTSVSELLRYVRICDAVYADTVEGFCEEAHLPLETIVRSHNGGVFSPKFILVLDHETQEIVLVVRGTASILDFCTDLCLMNEPFQDGQGHRGMVHTAQWLVQNVRPDLERLTQEHPEYALTITGHSLGAAVSALAAIELRPSFPTLRCIGYGTAACVTQNLAENCKDFVTMIVNGDDCVPRLHQHSLLKIQTEVAAFDWRTALKQMVAEEVEEQKTLAKKKRDEQMEQIHEAFERLKRTQQEQARAKLSTVLASPVGKRVSASLEITKAAFGTEGQPALERIASVKEVVQRHKSDDKIWEAIETSVEGLELVASAIKRPEELRALLRRSKALLASTIANDEDAKRPSQGESTAPESSKDIPPRLAIFKDRLTKLVDETAQNLRSGVKDKIGVVTETVTTNVTNLKVEAEAVIKVQTTRVEEEFQEIQQNVRSRAEELVRDVSETTIAGVPVRSLLSEFEIKSNETNQHETPEQLVENVETETAPVPELLHDPLFPPGQILYLHRVTREEAASSTAIAVTDAVELVEVPIDEFSRVLLSNRMILDHLCTTYERVLKTMDTETPPSEMQT
ncbi:hypothetical protein Poli38472_014543 [Pythium oligandrum]|uniref:Fungal lipase-type domain-containing protein n=1 Tax=Pythium oligandrum TaxID=41045 RepID=A0A8K1FIT5_PYTOL|nr:hypothetical protein Poli38472_014543 [Pythium oligandrum]|eukprot:TMW61082.1 hypothetical protein Poli38472_014543 [Pythium oligandrum]